MSVLDASWRRERAWLDDVVICDGLLPWTAGFLPPGADLITILQRFRASGIDHISITAAAGKDGPVEALARIGYLRQTLAQTGGQMRLVESQADILDAKRDAVLSVSLHFQTCTPFTDGFDLVEGFKAAGIVRALLAYNQANIFADGCHEPRNAGLSAAGRRLIARMNEAEMIVDLSHCGERTSLDALEANLSRSPIFSHSNARTLFDHERNISNTLLKALGQRGAYIGISGVGMFLGAAGPDIPEAMAVQAAYIAERVSPTQIGLGLDFMFLEGSDYRFFDRARYPNNYPTPPWDFLQPEQMGDLVAALEGKGFDQAELRGILGENYIRLAT